MFDRVSCRATCFPRVFSALCGWWLTIASGNLLSTRTDSGLWYLNPEVYFGMLLRRARTLQVNAFLFPLLVVFLLLPFPLRLSPGQPTISTMAATPTTTLRVVVWMSWRSGVGTKHSALFDVSSHAAAHCPARRCSRCMRWAATASI